MSCSIFKQRENPVLRPHGRRAGVNRVSFIVGSLVCFGDTVCDRIGRYGTTSTGSPPVDDRGESRPEKPDGNDTSVDGSARDSTAGHSRPRQGPCRPRSGERRPGTSLAPCQIPAVQEPPPSSGYARLPEGSSIPLRLRRARMSHKKLHYQLLLLPTTQYE